MRNWIKFDGVSLATYGLYCSGQGAFNAPARAVNTIAIPGRNGDIIGPSTRLQNIIVTYPCFVAGPNMKTNICNVRNFLLSKVGYKRLEDSYNPDEYRLAIYAGPFDAIADHFKAASFDLAFNCKPQRFLNSGATSTDFTANGTLTNPTLFNARPLIRVYGKGQVTINSDILTISNSYSYDFMDIDCDIGMAYYGPLNRNGFLTTSRIDFPELIPGSNSISLGTGITKVTITPRWWRV